MSCNNGYLRKQCQDKVDWEMEVCDRAGTPEEQKTILRDSEFEIYYNDRNEGENTVLMDPDWIFMDEGISDKEWEEVEKRLDADRLREADRWLLDIETDALRDAIRRLRKGQQNLIRLLLYCKKKEDAAAILGITSSAISGRIERIRNRLIRTLPPDALKMLTAGRRNN